MAAARRSRPGEDAHNNNHNSVVSPVESDKEGTASPRGQVRSIPPWILTPDANKRHTGRGLLPPPTPVIPHHQYLPEAQRTGGRNAKGRRWDHLRDAEPATLDQTLSQSSARWIPFMVSGPQYRSSETEGARTMSDEWMEENVPFWTADSALTEEHLQDARSRHMLDLARRRKNSVTKAKGIILRNPFIPLVFRTITTVFTLAALALGAHVWRQTKHLNDNDDVVGCRQRASTYLSIIIDSIAIPYTVYVTWDEYTAKPLGLRSATAKTALLLLDLYFIVFYSSNLSLAFDALTDPRWACFSDNTETCARDQGICRSQRGLTAVLLVALVAWMGTFSISVLRVVKRLRPDE